MSQHLHDGLPKVEPLGHGGCKFKFLTDISKTILPPAPALTWSDFDFDNLKSRKYYLIVVLICTYFNVSEIKHVFFFSTVYLRPFCVSFSVNSDYTLFHTSIGLIVFFLLICRNIFYINEVIALPNVFKILFPSV